MMGGYSTKVQQAQHNWLTLVAQLQCYCMVAYQKSNTEEILCRYLRNFRDGYYNQVAQQNLERYSRLGMGQQIDYWMAKQTRDSIVDGWHCRSYSRWVAQLCHPSTIQQISQMLKQMGGIVEVKVDVIVDGWDCRWAAELPAAALRLPLCRALCPLQAYWATTGPLLGKPTMYHPHNIHLSLYCTAFYVITVPSIVCLLIYTLY